jgi:hypothetical protein
MSAASIGRPVAAADRPRIVMEMLTSAADLGQPCPTNASIAERLGAKSDRVALETLSVLEAQGLITVRRFHASRVVTIRESGRSTEDVVGKKARERGFVRSNGSRRPTLNRAQLDQFAEAVSEVGTVSGAARAIGISEGRGSALFQLIKAELGPQAC